MQNISHNASNRTKIMTTLFEDLTILIGRNKKKNGKRNHKRNQNNIDLSSILLDDEESTCTYTTERSSTCYSKVKDDNSAVLVERSFSFDIDVNNSESLSTVIDSNTTSIQSCQSQERVFRKKYHKKPFNTALQNRNTSSCPDPPSDKRNEEKIEVWSKETEWVIKKYNRDIIEHTLDMICSSMSAGNYSQVGDTDQDLRRNNDQSPTSSSWQKKSLVRTMKVPEEGNIEDKHMNDAIAIEFVPVTHRQQTCVTKFAVTRNNETDLSSTLLDASEREKRYENKIYPRACNSMSRSISLGSVSSFPMSNSKILELRDQKRRIERDFQSRLFHL